MQNLTYAGAQYGWCELTQPPLSHVISPACCEGHGQQHAQVPGVYGVGRGQAVVTDLHQVVPVCHGQAGRVWAGNQHRVRGGMGGAAAPSVQTLQLLWW